MRKLGVTATILVLLAVVVALPADATRLSQIGAGLLKPGTHKTSNFEPALTYRVGPGWNNFCDSPGDVCFTPPGGNPAGVDA